MRKAIMITYRQIVENALAKLHDVEDLILGPAEDVDPGSLTPRELHELGLCNKAQLHYECHGRDNFNECN
jgi:hypothetical protein